MRSFTAVSILSLLLLTMPIFSQEPVKESKSDLQTENLKKDSENLDKEVATFSKKIGDVVKEYNLMEAEVQILPYRTSYEKGDGYIQMTRHTFIRRDINGEITGIRTKTMRIYGSGESISKLESEVFERNYIKGTSEKVIVTDPSPASEDTTDITFTHTYNGIYKVKDKKLSEVKNTTAFPVANSIKRDFYIPHLSFFYYSIRTIGETWNKTSKDTDAIMTDFLTESTDY